VRDQHSMPHQPAGQIAATSPQHSVTS